MFQFNASKQKKESTDLIVRDDASTATSLSVVVARPEQKIVDNVNNALLARHACLSKVAETLTFHNAVVSATTANSFVAQIIPGGTCDASTTNSTIISGVNIAVSQIAQLGKLYSGYAEVRDLQNKLYAAIPYDQIELCYFVDDAKKTIVETELNERDIANFVARHGKATIKMLNSDIEFTLYYNGIFQKRTLPIVGMVLSTAATVLFLCQSLVKEVDDVLQAQGAAVSTVVGIAPSVPFMSLSHALETVFHNKKMAIYEACAQIVRFKSGIVSEEVLQLMASFVDERHMLENRKILRELATDVEAQGRPNLLKG